MLKKIARTIWKVLTPSLQMKIIRTTQQTFTVSVAAIIINENDEVLLLDHVLRSRSSWGFPGGFINRNEQPENAVKREIKEETGLELYEVEFFRVRTNQRHIEILFSAKATGKAELRSREINDLGWFKLDEMPEKTHEGQKNIVKKVLETRRQNQENNR